MPQTSRRKLSHSLKCKLSIFAFMWSENCQKPQLPFLAAVKVAKACHFPDFLWTSSYLKYHNAEVEKNALESKNRDKITFLLLVISTFYSSAK